MVKEIIVDGKNLFSCEVCGFGYKKKEFAQKCEDWCSETGTCSIEITEHAVYFPEE